MKGTKYTHAPLAAPSAFEHWEHEQKHQSKRHKSPVAGGVLYYNADKTKMRNPETHRWVNVHGPLGDELMMKYGTPVEQLGGDYQSSLTDVYNSFVQGVNKFLVDLNLVEKPAKKQVAAPKKNKTYKPKKHY